MLFQRFHLGIISSSFLFSILRHMTPQMIMGRHIMVGVIILAPIRIEALSIIIVAVIVFIVELT